ncbi:hypothetical protein [Streptomyces sp. NPDC001068]|uniref:hypothetical protein n=1 Tax=Streptomyces sp. NPDC001068 TaxID=3364544 RepID=UPI0036C18A91
MTGREQPLSKKAVDEFGRTHDEMLGALDSVIDVEAGLREILLQSDHDEMAKSLESVVDVEAGLRAILPSPTNEEPLIPPAPALLPARASMKEILRMIPSQSRMLLRNEPRFLVALDAIDLIIAADACLHDLGIMAASLFDALYGTRMNLEKAVECSVAFVYTADKILRTIREAEELGVWPDNVNAEGNFSQVVVYSKNLAAAIDRASEAHRAYQARNRRERLQSGNRRARQNERELFQELTFAQKEVERVAHNLDSIVPVGLATRLYHGALEYMRRYLQTYLYVQGFPTLNHQELRDFVNDFTSSDLRGTLLIGTDLTDVRWTISGTLWPQEIDVEDLKTRSYEAPEGSGIYVVRSGTATIRELAELA